MNRVKISVGNEEAMKLLWEEVQRYYHFQLEKTEREMHFSVNLDDEVFTDIVKRFTMENKMHLLQLQYGEEEKEVETQIQSEEENEEEEEEVWFDDRRTKRSVGLLTRKDQVLNLFTEKKEWTSKEIQETLSMRGTYVSCIMSTLVQEGIVKKIQRGEWETTEIREKKSFSQAAEEAILKSFSNIVQEMSVLLLHDITGYTHIAIQKSLEALEKKGKVRQTTEGNWRLTSFSYPHSGIFENKSYEPILKAVMPNTYLNKKDLMKRFSKELVMQFIGEMLQEECIIEEEDNQNKYKIYMGSRIIYFLSRHPGATILTLRTKMPSIREKEICFQLDYLMAENVVERRSETRGGYYLLSEQ